MLHSSFYILHLRPKGANAHQRCAAARGIAAEPPASRQSLLAGDGADSPTQAHKKTTTQVVVFFMQRSGSPKTIYNERPKFLAFSSYNESTLLIVAFSFSKSAAFFCEIPFK
jgi:hypothetical protein